MGKREGDHAERNEEPEQGCTQISHGEEETGDRQSEAKSQRCPPDTQSYWPRQKEGLWPSGVGGETQGRGRIFLTGHQETPEKPGLTHSYPPGVPLGAMVHFW